MKKMLTAKYLSLFMLLSLLGGKAQARHYDDDYRQVSDCCASSCYECGCNPLYCGAWDLQVHGGVNPILWRHRGAIEAVGPVVAPATTLLVSLGELPKFRTFYKTPWTVGGQLGYAMSDNTRVYLEFNYSQAKAKSDEVFTSTFTPTGGTAFPVLFNLGKYKLFDGYVGLRYYWDRWCDRVSFFLGGKVGFTHHKRVNTTLSFVTTAPATPGIAATELFTRNTVVSGGADFGLDVCFCGNWSFVITGAVIASCGPDSGAAITIPANTTGSLGFTNLLVGHIRTELRFPVTVGVRYSF